MRGDRGGAGGAQGGAGQGSEHPEAHPGAQAQPTPLSSSLSPPLLTTQLSLCLQILQGPPGASVPLFKGEKNLNRPEVLSPGPTHSTVPIRVPGSSGHHGWFPRLPPGRTWGWSTLRSEPSLSHLRGRCRGSDKVTERLAGLDPERRGGREGTTQTLPHFIPSENLQRWSLPPRRLKNSRATL